MMTDMMKAVMSYGYGLNASVSGVPMGKTGTSNYTDSETDTILASIPEANYSYMVVPDENFVGYSSQYAMAVWTGYTNRMTPILDNSMRIATDVYHNMMLFMHSDYTATDWEMPSGLVRYGSNYYLRGSRSLSNAYNTYTSYSTSSSSSTETSETAEATTTSSETSSGTSTETATSSTETATTGNNPATGQTDGQ